MSNIHFGLKLVNNKDNIRPAQKADDTSWVAGDFLTLSSGVAKPLGTVGTDDSDLITGILGVAMTNEASDARAVSDNVHAPVNVLSPDQIWSIKVEDGARAYDYKIGESYEVAYYGLFTASAYDIDYASGGTARTVDVANTFYLSSSSVAAISGAVVVAKPSRNIAGDLEYGGRVHVQFAPAACLTIAGFA